MTPPPRSLDVAAGWAWRILVVAAAVVAGALFLARLRLVVLPLFVALLLSTALRPVARRLRDRGVPSALAALAAFIVFFGALGTAATLATRPLVREVRALGPTLTKGFDEVQRWLADGPLGLDQARLDALRERAGSSIGQASPGLIRPAVALVEVVGGSILAMVLAFFLVKDGPELAEAFYRRVPSAHRDRVRRSGHAARRALGAFLRGAALLGIVEGAIIAIAMAAVGARLIVPVVLITLLGAFVPVVGAVMAGTLATLVTLVTAGSKQALIIGVVALVVQQLDNDLLAPLIYGRSVKLHPLAILLSIATGAALAGIAGTFVAVPVAAVVVAVRAAWHEDDDTPADARREESVTARDG